MDALHHEDGVGGESEGVAGMIPISGFEIVARGLDCLSRNELAEVLVEQWHIHGLEAVVYE